jgi:hypothetical protein
MAVEQVLASGDTAVGGVMVNGVLVVQEQVSHNTNFDGAATNASNATGIAVNASAGNTVVETTEYNVLVGKFNVLLTEHNAVLSALKTHGLIKDAAP